MTTAVADLVQAEASAREKAETKYAELVARMEHGEEIDKGQALRILRDAGKSPGDIDAELARRRRVTELRQRIEDAGDLRERRLELDDQLAAKKQEIEEVTTRLRDERVAIERQLDELGRQHMELDDARRELARIAPPPADEVARQKELNEVRAQIARLTATTSGRVDPDAGKLQMEELDRQIAAAREELDKLGPTTVLTMFTIPAAKRRLNGLKKERQQLEVRMNKSVQIAGDFRRLKQLRAKLAELQPDSSAN